MLNKKQSDAICKIIFNESNITYSEALELKNKIQNAINQGKYSEIISIIKNSALEEQHQKNIIHILS